MYAEKELRRVGQHCGVPLFVATDGRFVAELPGGLQKARKNRRTLERDIETATESVQDAILISLKDYPGARWEREGYLDGWWTQAQRVTVRPASEDYQGRYRCRHNGELVYPSQLYPYTSEAWDQFAALLLVERQLGEEWQRCRAAIGCLPDLRGPQCPSCSLRGTHSFFCDAKRADPA